MPSRKIVNDFTDEREKFDRALVHIEPLEAEHLEVSDDRRGSLRRRDVNVVLSVDVDVDLDGDVNLDVLALTRS